MRKTIAFILIILLYQSCYKNEDNSTITRVERPPRVLIDTELFGELKGELLSSYKNVNIRINNGFYSVQDRMLPHLSITKANKKGQFMELFSGNQRIGAAQVLLKENDINYLELHVADVFNKSSVGKSESIDFNLGSQVSYSNANFTTENGNSYDGELELVYHESESIEELNQISTHVINKDGLVSIAKPSRYLFYEFRTSNNEILKSQNSFFDLSLTANDHESIFWFNPEEQSWEWISNISNNENIQKITKTGWFLIGTGIEAVFLDTELKKENSPLSYAELELRSLDIDVQQFSTYNGHVLTFAPKSSDLHLDLLDPCGNNLQEWKIDVGTGDVEDQRINASSSLTSFLKDDFKILNCDGIFDEIASFEISMNGKSRQFTSERNTDGHWFPICDQEFSIRGINIHSGEAGPSIKWNNADESVRLLSSCPDHSEGFSWLKIREDAKVYSAFLAEKLPGFLILESEGEEMRLIVEMDSKGKLSGDKVNIKIDDPSFGPQGYFVSCENAEVGCGLDNTLVSHYIPDGDEWNRLYFTGRIWMQTIQPPQAGNFMVEGFILSKKIK